VETERFYFEQISINHSYTTWSFQKPICDMFHWQQERNRIGTIRPERNTVKGVKEEI
jgi:hypothetical protein